MPRQQFQFGRHWKSLAMHDPLTPMQTDNLTALGGHTANSNNGHGYEVPLAEGLGGAGTIPHAIMLIIDQSTTWDLITHRYNQNC
ncbi:hypothetical protein ACHAW6_012799 [Cyclotella cf. meneghiniana]